MGNGMNKVIDGLYVGSIRDSKSEQQLLDNHISHMISVLDYAGRSSAEIECLNISAQDQPNQNMSQYFAQCNDFIHTARLNGGNVLIHCLAGVSRSVTIAVAYLMSVTSLNWKGALKCVQISRQIANPNDGFQRQLQQFEAKHLRQERERLRQKFAGRTCLLSDENEVRHLLQLHRNEVPLSPFLSLSSSSSASSTSTSSSSSSSFSTTPSWIKRVQSKSRPPIIVSSIKTTSAFSTSPSPPPPPAVAGTRTTIAIYGPANRGHAYNRLHISIQRQATICSINSKDLHRKLPVVRRQSLEALNDKTISMQLDSSNDQSIDQSNDHPSKSNQKMNLNASIEPIIDQKSDLNTFSNLKNNINDRRKTKFCRSKTFTQTTAEISRTQSQ